MKSLIALTLVLIASAADARYGKPETCDSYERATGTATTKTECR